MTGLAPAHLRDMRNRQMFMIAAGPVASLITAILATALTLSAAGSAWEPGWEFFSALATLAWASAVFNFVPVRPEDQYSDGAQLYVYAEAGNRFEVRAWTTADWVASTLLPEREAVRGLDFAGHRIVRPRTVAELLFYAGAQPEPVRRIALGLSPEEMALQAFRPTAHSSRMSPRTVARGDGICAAGKWAGRLRSRAASRSAARSALAGAGWSRRPGMC